MAASSNSIGSTSRRRRLTWLFAAISFGGFSSFIPLSSVDQASADNPLFEPANRVARFLGIGYSDGYHAAQSRSNRAINDLPPASAYVHNQPVQTQLQALYPLPAQTYHLQSPAWASQQSQCSSCQPQFNHTIPASPSPQTYPVQPSLPPLQPIPVQVPTVENQSISPSVPQPPSKSPAQNPDPRPSAKPIVPEEIPAPNPGIERDEDLTSPSDQTGDLLLPGLPNQKQTDSLLDSLESLGDEELSDPLLPSVPSLESLPSLPDDEDSDSLLPKTNTGLPDATNDSNQAPDSNLDMELDIDQLLPPASDDDTDSLLNANRATSPQQFQPRSSRVPSLTSPQNPQARIFEPGTKSAPVSQPRRITPARLPRTASRIYEPTNH